MIEESSKIDTKTRSYLEQLLASRKFKERLKFFREEYAIPRSGFDLTVFDEMVVSEIYPRIPDKIIDADRFIKSINNMLSKYGFSRAWFDFFSDLILFNWLGDTKDQRQIFLMNLGHSNRYLADDKVTLEVRLQSNPIAILIPSFASQRDINEFISLNWAQIRAFQKKYGRKKQRITKFRRKNSRIKQRNDFIYNNRSLSKKDLMARVSDEFGDVMDYTYLAKIITEETKKRSANA